jgi:outer membrane protein assembly factor BamB
VKPVFALAALVAAPLAFAADWPQWRGPNGDAISPETGLLRKWPAGGPILAWTSRDAGRGFGAPAVVGDRVYVLGAPGENLVEQVIALGPDGRRLWAAPIAKAYDFRGNVWSLGPNSAPSVTGQSIFALGSQGVLICVDLAGKERWRVDLVKDLHGQVNPVTGNDLGWGYSWSPLVAGNRVVIAPGGEGGLLAALETATGSVVWRTKSIVDDCTYSSPVVTDIGGVRQVVYAAQNKVYGVSLADGSPLWSYEKKRQAEEIFAATPVVHDGQILTSGSAAGTELWRITKSGSTFTAEPAWSGKQLANLHGGLVLLHGHVFASDEKRAWKCLDLSNGKVAWESTRPGVGSLVAADGCLYGVSQDRGTVSLIEASPDAMRLNGQFTLPERSRLRRPSAGLWTHPVLAGGRLYLRDQEILFCYDVKGQI